MTQNFIEIMIKLKTLKDALCQDPVLGRKIPPQNLVVKQFAFFWVVFSVKANPSFFF